MITPGFAADCLETLSKRSRWKNAAIFKQTGGENFIAIPCLNDTDEGMRVIREVALTELKGWLEIFRAWVGSIIWLSGFRGRASSGDRLK